MIDKYAKINQSHHIMKYDYNKFRIKNNQFGNLNIK